MTRITLQGGKLVLRDGKVGTEQACCCEKCEGPCDTNEECSPGCKCQDGECVAVSCSDCFKNCCLFIQGRNLCEPDTVFDENGIAIEGWFFLPFSNQYVWQSQVPDVSSNYIVVTIGTCGEDGIPLYVESGSSLNDELPAGIANQWFNARASLGPDGCPNGVVLGDVTVACDTNAGCGGSTPVNPEISFECVEFDPFF
jgi:hypothetical protein